MSGCPPKAIYALAAETAPLVGLDLDEDEFSISVKAQAQAALRVKLRNWTGKPRRWTAGDLLRLAGPAR